jgi:hypothetical protein
VTATAVKIKLEDAELRRTLERLPMNVNEALRKRVFRKVLKPYVGDLGRKWLMARFRGPSMKHRLAISAATEMTSPRRMHGQAGVIAAQIGVRYGRKAKNSSVAKGRQRVFHLLESGFKHKASGGRVAGRFISYRWALFNVQKIMRELSAEALLEAKKLLLKGGKP